MFLASRWVSCVDVAQNEWVGGFGGGPWEGIKGRYSNSKFIFEFKFKFIFRFIFKLTMMMVMMLTMILMMMVMRGAYKALYRRLALLVGQLHNFS